MFFRIRFETLSNEIVLNPFSSHQSDGIDITFDLCSSSIEDLSLLDIDMLETIISSDSLRIESEDWLLKIVIELGEEYSSSLFDHIRFEFLSDDGLSLFLEHFTYCDLTEAIWDGVVRRLSRIEDSDLRSRRFSSSSQARSRSDRQLDSVIISTIPSIFSDFGQQSCRLLYRGSRDGFDFSSFHKKVDGHSHTITIIETTKGFIFGGYTPCEWDSSGSWKSDNSMKRFIFTLKNPHNIPARKFSLKPQRKDYAVLMHANSILIWFGYSGAVGILSDCNTNDTNHRKGFATSSDCSYENDAGHDGRTLFIGESTFMVKELEIFELID
jgi:hypothetical protein